MTQTDTDLDGFGDECDWNFIDFSLGGIGCGILADQSGLCWNSTDAPVNGRRLVDDDIDRLLPPADARFLQIAGGDGMGSCGILTDESVLCWGDGQLESYEGYPASTEKFTQVEIGGQYACAIQKADHYLYCWGERFEDPESLDEFSSRTFETGYLHFEMWNETVCAVVEADGSLDCFNLQFDGGTGSIYSPPGGTGFDHVAMGLLFACAHAVDDHVECWGRYQHLQTTVLVGESFVQVATGFATACGLRGDGTVGCWGLDHALSMAIPAGVSLDQIGMDRFGGCGLDAIQTLHCWGNEEEDVPYMDPCSGEGGGPADDPPPECL